MRSCQSFSLGRELFRPKTGNLFICILDPFPPSPLAISLQFMNIFQICLYQQPPGISIQIFLASKVKSFPWVLPHTTERVPCICVFIHLAFSLAHRNLAFFRLSLYYNYFDLTSYLPPNNFLIDKFNGDFSILI